MSTVSLLAPAPGLAIQTRQGTTYTADANGIIKGVVQQWDIADLLNAGCLFTTEAMLYQAVSGGTPPAATGNDVVVAVCSLPANFFSEAGVGIEATMIGKMANNTNVKTAKIIANPATAVIGSTVGTGGTTIATTGAYSTTGAAGFTIGANILKYGSGGSNTQFYVETEVIIGSTHSGQGVPTACTLTESGVILIAFTINAATTATDCELFMAQVEAVNGL